MFRHGALEVLLGRFLRKFWLPSKGVLQEIRRGTAPPSKLVSNLIAAVEALLKDISSDEAKLQHKSPGMMAIESKAVLCWSAAFVVEGDVWLQAKSQHKKHESGHYSASRLQ